jgi:hypothetical protein
VISSQAGVGPAGLDSAHRNASTVWRTAGSLVFALLVHAALLIGLALLIDPPGAPPPAQQTLTVELRPNPEKPAAQAAPPPAAATPPLVQKRGRSEPVKQPRKSRPAQPEQPEPEPEPPRQARETEPTDISAMIAAARERRRASGVAAQEPGENRAAPASQGNEIALDNIRRSTQQARGRDGVNGLFQILHKGPRIGRFSFRGWQGGSARQWNRVIEVDAGPNGDVERAIVRKMIELIRQHHNGDFEWDSRRLGRVVPLSARPQDAASLEEFLMREFFG